MNSNIKGPEQPATRLLDLPMGNAPQPFSGERFTWQAEGTIVHEHVHRYLSAMSLCTGKRVLDIACGEGYGTAALATVAAEVTGVDIDAATIEHCRRQYPAANLRFEVGSATRIPLADGSVDVVVSFETLEHLEEHDEFLAEIRRVLTGDGLLVMSTPDKRVYSPEGTPPNEFHVRELEREEFIQFLRKNFRHTAFSGQVAASGSIIAPLGHSDAALSIFDRVADNRYKTSDDFADATYLIGIGSDRAIPDPIGSVLLDRDFLPKLHAAYRAELERVWGEVAQRERGTEAKAQELVAVQLDLGRHVAQMIEERKAFEDEKQALQARTTEAEAAREGAARQLAAEQARAGELDAQLRQLRQQTQRLQAMVNEIRASTSWRITAPIRAAKRGVDRLRASPDLARAARSKLHRLSRGTGRGTRSLVEVTRHYRLVANSEFFSAEWYRQTYPDIAASGRDPVRHFLEHGAREGRDPGPLFSTQGYLHRYPDVAGTQINPLVHYLRFGRQEGRSCLRIGLNPSADPRPGHVPQPAVATDPQAVGHPDNAVIATAAASTLRLKALARAAALQYRPLVSILLPTYNTPVQYLHLAVQSVLRQTYVDWELCIVDDGSTSIELKTALDGIAAMDRRIRIRRNDKNQGISGATNDGIDMAQGEFVAMLDHDDELLDNALLEIVAALNEDRTIDALYTDQDYIEADGSPSGLLLKPDWSPLLFCGVMFVGHLLVVRRDLARAVGGFDGRFDNVQDFEFMLRISERTDRIRHVPQVLYHWRRIPGSVAFRGDAKSNIEGLQSAAVTAHLERKGLNLVAVPHPRHAHRASLQLRAPMSVPITAITMRSAQAAGNDSPAVVARLERSAARVVSVAAPRAERADGQPDWLAQFRSALQGQHDGCLVFVQEDVAVEGDDWLQLLAAHASMPGVGVVSAVTVTSQRKVVDAGLIRDPDGSLRPAMSGWDVESDGYAGSLSCAREVIAVSGTLVAISLAVLRELGGPTDRYLTPRAVWTDLSLRASASGRRNIVVPDVHAIRDAGQPDSPAAQLDELLLREAWSRRFAHDPYHNEAFGTQDGGYAL